MIKRYVPIQMTTSLLVEMALCPGTQVTCSIEGFGRPRPDQRDVIKVYRGPAGGREVGRGENFEVDMIVEGVVVLGEKMNGC
jgi:hypothetical protein